MLHKIYSFIKKYWKSAMKVNCCSKEWHKKPRNRQTVRIWDRENFDWFYWLILIDYFQLPVSNWAKTGLVSMGVWWEGEGGGIIERVGGLVSSSDTNFSLLIFGTSHTDWPLPKVFSPYKTTPTNYNWIYLSFVIENKNKKMAPTRVLKKDIAYFLYKSQIKNNKHLYLNSYDLLKKGVNIFI